MSPTQLESDHAEQLLAQLWLDPFMGQLAQVLNPGVPARSNLQYLGISGHTDGALAATGVGCVVPVPVVNGDYISQVSVPIGATAGATMTHQFAALYGSQTAPASAVPLAQSTDTTSAAIAATKLATWTLATPVLVTPTNAPNGYLFAQIAITATTVPTALVVTVPTATAYAWLPGMPPFFAATAGSALAGTAANPLGTCTAKAAVPYVILS